MLPFGKQKNLFKNRLNFIYISKNLKAFLELMFIFSFKRVEKFERKKFLDQILVNIKLSKIFNS
jgi:hypothetical protein